MVLYISIGIVLLFVLWGIFLPNHLTATADQLLDITIEKFGWFYLIAAFTFLIVSIYLAFSKYGKIRLGADEDRPEYSNITWFGMLFSAGMGIGLVFWGVAEPIYHYLEPPMGITPETSDAASMAMRYSFFHWGLHPWAIYTIIALALAYFNFRKGHNGLISYTFYPLLGEGVKGRLGKLIDVLAIIATVFGVATSLGLGALQINGGLAHIFGIANAPKVQLIIIAIVTVLYMISATTGLDRGIKILSNANITVAALLLIFTLFLGPTSFIFDTFTSTLGGYLQNIIHMSLRLRPFAESRWIGQWTLFYWAWWIAWAPFVGTFIARVSKGRTIKEFILGVLLVPSIFSFMWFSVFGGTALNFEIFQNLGIANAVEADVTSALFITLQQLPLGMIVSLLATLLIITFFITSADSATFVLGMLSSNGDLNPSKKVKYIWGILQSSIAVVLLLSGGLEGLQKMAIIIALPFAIIMSFMCYSLYKGLSEEYDDMKRNK
ncbi:glycine betaine uptake BCCT transporter [Alkaliphilus transvaalensis]|uniref:glycine betaine uptake BCCT transporter n=1 Tax=Alkaliphilus transvaalensis TaxID=114628 RepID=UPI0006874C60|nr:BCCT family transporter [Alkaliphilus transvaalensis]